MRRAKPRPQSAKAGNNLGIHPLELGKALRVCLVCKALDIMFLGILRLALGPVLATGLYSKRQQGSDQGADSFPTRLVVILSKGA